MREKKEILNFLGVCPVMTSESVEGSISWGKQSDGLAEFVETEQADRGMYSDILGLKKLEVVMIKA